MENKKLPFAVLQIQYLAPVSSLISQTSSIDTIVHNRYESHRKLATCVDVIIHPK